MIVVATCNELFEAEVLAKKLQAHGIEACIQNKNNVGFLVSPYARTNEFNVLVMDMDFEAATEIVSNC